MRGWGTTLILLGVGSFLLPFFGMQFRLMSLFGDSPVVPAMVMICAGGALFYFGDSDE